MKSSPFKYGFTVSGKSFTNREAEKNKLLNNLISGINTTIISPRRWGKSSLVEAVISDIKKKYPKHKTVEIDLFYVSSEEEFLEIFAEKVIKASASKWEDRIKNTKEFFKHLIPTINLGIDPNNDFSIKFKWEEITKHKDEILNLPEVIAQKKDIKFIISMDEFQNLATFKEYAILEKRIRSVWQRQKHTTYCLFGSKRHMMSEIFNNTSKPFYRFGDVIFLQKIDSIHWVKFIIKKFKETKKEITPEDATIIAKTMGNHSWYVQQLSSYVWERTETVAGKAEIQSAINELVYANSPFFLKEIEVLSSTQINLLRAIANNEIQLTSIAVMSKYRIGTPQNIIKNIRILSNNDIIDKYNGKHEILDPAFRLWFLKQFYNVDFTKMLTTD